MAKDSQSPMGHYIKDLEALDSDPVDKVSKIIKEHVTNSDSSRSVVYRELNPMLSLHPMYHSEVCETYRVDTTRLILSSHRLKIETGRWSTIPCDECLCPCGDGNIQSEAHIIIHCEYTRNLRERYTDLNYDNPSWLMQCQNINQLCEYCYKVNQLLTA